MDLIFSMELEVRLIQVDDFCAILDAGVCRLWFPACRNLVVYAIAGLIVGFGTRLGGGCTSGHGICGISMGARDSMIATFVFMVAGMAAVYVFRTLVTG